MYVQISQGKRQFWGCPAHSKALAISAAVFAAKKDNSIRMASVTINFTRREKSAPAMRPFVEIL